ncbi:MAG: type II toxin-antitoxin system prevent-host-death family antitoxin [Streptosporangiales bacterium]|nr:type II toxin-antitoxin system prevent-host-death family antitoxin [Streptosporangiales bacterium]
MISQRELRNNSAEVMNAVEGGETMIVSRNGVPVAELRPIPHRALVPTAELRRAGADGARIDYAAMREEMDELFGEDRIGG